VTIRSIVAAACVVRALSLFAWVSPDDVNVDFRHQNLRLDGRTGGFSVADSRAPDAPYVSGILKCGRIVRAERDFHGPDREQVVLCCVRDGVTNRVTVTVDYEQVRLVMPDGVTVEGVVRAGTPDPAAVMAVRRDEQPAMLCSVSGPAVPAGADGVYDRRTDALYAIDGATLRPTDGGRRIGFSGSGAVAFAYRGAFLAHRFHISAKTVPARYERETPPVGWMTWYAVKFAACDDVVLRNARAFKRAFGGYTDERPVLWVDWEWCHEDLAGGATEGEDLLTVRTKAYPRGLRAVSDDLRALGFKPALWVSMLNDVTTNALWRTHPEWVLGERANWSGAVWGDPTAPGFCEEFLPTLVKRYRDDWGFEAFKWDTLYNALWAFDLFRNRLHDASRTPEQVYRRAIAAGRRCFGPDVYLVGCAGYCDREILGAIDLFDAFRVGGDIFSWTDFREEGVNRILHYYPLHNTHFWADADNLVLREGHSTLAQARTRVSVYALAGVPITLGDEITALDGARLDLVRRAMPVVPLRPAALGPGSCPDDNLDLCADFARPFGTWQVRGWSNLSTNRVRNVSFAAPGRAVWDYWNDRLETATVFAVAPGDTKVVRVTPLAKEGPTLLSVSRHLTQGGYELVSYAADAAGARGVVKCPGGETVRVSFLLPKGAQVLSASHPHEREGDVVRMRIDAGKRSDVPFDLRLTRPSR